MESNSNQQDQKMRKIDRLDKFAAYKGFNDNKITRLSGIAVGTLGKSRKEGKDITGRTCESVLSAFPELNREWLIYGEGDMLVGTKAKTVSSYPEYPFINDTKAECGALVGTLDSKTFNNFPMLSFPGIPADTEFFIQASGYSMVNTDRPELSIPPGAFIGLAKINSSIVRWGETYALATPDGIMIKRVFPAEDSDQIRCVSYNSTDYPEFMIDRSDVRDVARITCVIPVYVR